MRKNFSILIFTLLFIFSCAKEKPYFTPSKLSILWRKATDDYLKVVRKWTKEGRLYNEFETVMITTVTYNSWEVRKAYIEREAKLKGLSEKEKNKLLEKERKEFEKANEFYVACYVGKDEWNKLHKKESIWSVVLINHLGKTFKPISIEDIDEKEKVKIWRTFDIASPWRKIYKITFPKFYGKAKNLVLVEDKPFKLEFRSYMGVISLKWR